MVPQEKLFFDKKQVLIFPLIYFDLLLRAKIDPIVNLELLTQKRVAGIGMPHEQTRTALEINTSTTITQACKILAMSCFFEVS